MPYSRHHEYCELHTIPQEFLSPDNIWAWLYLGIKFYQTQLVKNHIRFKIGLNPSDWYPYEENRETQRQALGPVTIDALIRDGTTSQDRWVLPGVPRSKEENREYSFLEILEEAVHCWPLYFGLLASITMREYICIVLVYQFCDNLLWKP